MDYKIEEIEGIGPVYGEKLKAAGISRVDQLLEECAAKSGRVSVSYQWHRTSIFRIAGSCRCGYRKRAPYA